MVTTALQATPRPWELRHVNRKYGLALLGAPMVVSVAVEGNEPIAIVHSGDANAELIVRAVNNLDPLVAALEAALPELIARLNTDRTNDRTLAPLIRQVEAALKNARGGR